MGTLIPAGPLLSNTRDARDNSPKRLEGRNTNSLPFLFSSTLSRGGGRRDEGDEGSDARHFARGTLSGLPEIMRQDAALDLRRRSKKYIGRSRRYRHRAHLSPVDVFDRIVCCTFLSKNIVIEFLFSKFCLYSSE